MADQVAENRAERCARRRPDVYTSGFAGYAAPSHHPRAEVDVTFALTKIKPPRNRPGLVHRPRLDAALDEGVRSKRLVLVCAAAGFGKTALLARCVGQFDASTALAWISVDEDDDLIRFADGLVAALDPLDLPWRTSPDALLVALDGGRAARAALVAELVNALLAAQVERGVIVVDDAHRIDDPLVFELLDILIERLPAAWSVVVSSRSEPPLALARLRSRGEVLELREDALRFTEAEVQALLDAESAGAQRTGDPGSIDPADGTRGQHSAAGAAELMQCTDGWAAGLMLVTGPAGRSRALSGGVSRRQLFDYLAVEVVAAMPHEMRTFLLRCSVLAELSPARCAAVSGSANAAQLLAEVERRAPFVVVLDESEPVLRLHDLFRDCLEDLLRRELAGEVPALLARAAQSEVDPLRRVGYLLQSGDSAAAESALAEVGASLIAAGQVGPVRRLIDQFTPAWREASPRLAHLRGLSAWAHWDLVTTCTSLERAATLYSQQGAHDAAQRARVLMVIGLTAGGQVHRAMQLLDELRCQPMDAHTETTAWQATSWHLLAASRFGDVAAALGRMVELLDGSADPMLWFQSVPPTEMLGLPGARPHLQRYVAGALARTPGEPPEPLRVLANLLQAALHLWDGRHETAAEMLRAAESDCRWLNRPPNLIGHLHRIAALCHAVRGEHEAALASADALLHGLTADARTSGRARVWLNHMLYFKLRVAATLGDAAMQRELATRIAANADPGENPMFLRERACLPARLAELDQRWADAAALYAECLADEAALDLYGQGPEVRVRFAHAWLRGGRLADASAALAPLFARLDAGGEAGGVMFAGGAILQALAQAPWGGHMDAARRQQVQTWAGWLAHRSPGEEAHPLRPAAPGTGASRAAELLSAREREVLRCIAAGDSNKLIARAFDLSPNTVKRHVSNILDKLGLNSRGQAAAWYRQQG